MQPRPPSDAVLDSAHLERQCLGDAALARELLVLFDRQCVRLAPPMTSADPGTAREAAHTLRGAAAAVGAVEIARLAARIEADPGSVPSAALAAAVEDVRRLIALRIGGAPPGGGGSALAKPDRVA